MILLQTARLVMREHQPGDLPEHHRLMSSARAMYYLQDIACHSLEASRANLRAAMAEAQKPEGERTRYFLCLCLGESGQHIGSIGYTVTDFTPGGKTVECGYFTHPEHWGNGYVTEAMTELLRFAFEQGGVHRLTAGCLRDNAGSRRVMEKCGMRLEADRPQHTWHDGRFKDRVEYRLLRSEWQADQHDKKERV